MDLLQLQYFRAIANSGSMTKAAKLLFVSQPNLSISLSRLEEDLGVKLFDRRRGKITLTENGELFLSYVNTALNAIDEGISALRERENIDANTIRLAVTQPDIVYDVLRQFYPKGSQIEIRQMTCMNEDIFDQVLEHAADFGLFYGKPKSSALEYNVVVESERILAVSNEHPLAKRSTVALFELKNESFICNRCRDDQSLFQALPEYSGFKPHVRYECDDTKMESTLITMSKGVSIMPASALQKMVRDDATLPIVGIRIADVLPLAQLGIVRHRGKRLSDASLAFLANMKELFLRDEHDCAMILERLRNNHSANQ